MITPVKNISFSTVKKSKANIKNTPANKPIYKNANLPVHSDYVRVNNIY